MGNILFAHPNFADVDHYTPVLSGGSWEAALPLSNLQHRVLSRVARSTDAALASTQFHADLAVTRDVRAVVIPSHNLSRAGKVRARASTRIAFSGVRLAAAASAGASSITVECPGGSAMIRSGQTFLLGGEIYKAASDLGMGGNYHENSEDLSHSNYAPTGATVSVNQITAPDGAATADLVTEDTSAGAHKLNVSGSFAFIAPDQRITSSAFVKAHGDRHFRLKQQDPPGDATVDFDLSTGEVLSSSTTGVAVIVASGAEALPGGWFRVWMTVDRAGGGGTTIDGYDYAVLDGGGSASYAGDGESGVYLWGIQVEAGNLSAYIQSGDPEVHLTNSGSISIAPNLAGNVSAGDALTALCGDYISYAPAADSGWQDIFPVIYPFGSLPWGHPSVWDGRVSEEERGEYPSPFLHLPDTAASARYWLIEVDDTGNGDGYVELSRLFLARGYQPSRNFGYGAQLGAPNASTMKETDGGARYYNRRPPRRSIQATVGYLPDDEALVSLYDMIRRVGIDEQIFISLNPDDTQHLRRHSFLATLGALQALEYSSFGRKSMQLQFEEVL